MNKYVSGPLAILIVPVVFWLLVAVTRTTDLGGGLARDFAVVLTPLCLIFGGAAFVTGVYKRRALRVSRLTGTRAFCTLAGDNNLSLLVDRRGYSGPMSPVVTQQNGFLEFWRHDGETEPFARIPIAEISATFVRRRDPWPRAAIKVEAAGLYLPLFISLYGDEWWSVVPVGEDRLQEINEEVLRLPIPHRVDAP